MTLEYTQIITYPLIDIFAILAMVFAVLTVRAIYKKKGKETLKKHLGWTFSLMAIGYVFYAIAELIWDYLTIIGIEPVLGIPDLLWALGMVFIFAGFLYFTIYILKDKENHNKTLTSIFFTALIVGAIVFYLVGNFIIGFQEEETTLEIVADYFWPIGSAIIVVVSMSVYSFFRKFEDMSKPLLLLALAAFSTFLADMLYTYYAWNEIYGIPGVLSEIFYLSEYILAFAGFFILWKLLKNK